MATSSPTETLTAAEYQFLHHLQQDMEMFYDLALIYTGPEKEQKAAVKKYLADRKQDIRKKEAMSLW